MPKEICSLWELLGVNAAAVIALCALGVSLYQVIATRKHNRLSVKPHLTSFVTRDLQPGKGRVAFTLINKGLGPAVIRAFVSTLDGHPIAIGVPREQELILKRLLGDRPFDFSMSTLESGYALSKDERKDVLTLQFPAANQTEFDGVMAQLDRLSLRVEYASMYDEEFVFLSDGGELKRKP